MQTLTFRRPILLILLIFSAWSQAAEPGINWNEVVVIDVRSHAEWQSGHLADSIWIPWTQIEQGIKRHELSPDQALAFYCERGIRADRAIRRLQRLGFTRTYNLIDLAQASRITRRKIEK